MYSLLDYFFTAGQNLLVQEPMGNKLKFLQMF